MGIIIYSEDDRDSELWMMGMSTGSMFIATSNAAAEVYGLAGPVIYWDDAEVLVRRNLFLTLVEKVFAEPTALLTSWAEEASHCYGVLTEELWDFVWDVNGVSTWETRFNFLVGPSRRTSMKGVWPQNTMGPKHINLITGFKPRSRSCMARKGTQDDVQMSRAGQPLGFSAKQAPNPKSVVDVFSATSPPRHLDKIGYREARIFVSFTAEVARYNEMKERVSYWEGPALKIEPTPFCILLERVLNSPVYFDKSWAEMATQFYLAFNGEMCEFVWDRYQLSSVANRSDFYIGVSRGLVPSTNASTKIIGPRHLNAETGFVPR